MEVRYGAHSSTKNGHHGTPTPQKSCTLSSAETSSRCIETPQTWPAEQNWVNSLHPSPWQKGPFNSTHLAQWSSDSYQHRAFMSNCLCPETDPLKQIKDTHHLQNNYFYTLSKTEIKRIESKNKNKSIENWLNEMKQIRMLSIIKERIHLSTIPCWHKKLQTKTHFNNVQTQWP